MFQFQLKLPTHKLRSVEQAGSVLFVIPAFTHRCVGGCLWAVSLLSVCKVALSSSSSFFLPFLSVSQGDIHEDFCSVCRKSGQLLMCDTCSRVYHLDCLDPPLKTIPKGMWICPRCQDQVLGVGQGKEGQCHRNSFLSHSGE